MTGTPIRELGGVDVDEARERFGGRPGERILLVFGGSQAVRRINDAVTAALPRLVERVRVVHVTGDDGYAAALAARETLPEALRDRYRPYPFLHEEMTAALAAADLAVGRAGASTLAEAAAFALPTAIVPYPHAAGHQRLNAESFAAAGAAILIEDEDLDADRLVEVAGLLADPARHARHVRRRARAREAGGGGRGRGPRPRRRPRRDAPDAGRDRGRRPRRPSVTADAFDPFAVGTEIQRRIGVKTVRDEPLARFTTMKVGGPADLFAVAHNPFELRGLVKFARARAIPYTILGRGSDLVIADAGIRGLVIQVRAEASRVDGERYYADAGVQMARAATETQKAGLTGLEFGLAIPGTVGGAVWANAGAHENDTAHVLESATVLLEDGSERVLPVEELGLQLPAQPVQGRRAAARRRPGRDRRRRPRSGSGPRIPTRSRPASTRSAAGGGSTSRWASRPRARCSATPRATRPAG